MTERKRIQLIGGGELELVGEGSVTLDAEAALEEALAALKQRAGVIPAPPAGVRGTSIFARAALVWAPVLDAVAYHILRPAAASEARYPEDARYRTSGEWFLDDAVAPGATYFYAVASENGDRDVSSPSEIVSVSITVDAPAAPETRTTPSEWKPQVLEPPVALDWKPSIGAPAWANLDVAELSLRSLFDVESSQLRPFVLASLDDSMPYRSRLTEALDHMSRNGCDRPFVGLSLDSSGFGRDAASQRALASELGGLANDLGHFGVGLAIRMDS